MAPSARDARDQRAIPVATVAQQASARDRPTCHGRSGSPSGGIRRHGDGIRSAAPARPNHDRHRRDPRRRCRRSRLRRGQLRAAAGERREHAAGFGRGRRPRHPGAQNHRSRRRGAPPGARGCAPGVGCHHRSEPGNRPHLSHLRPRRTADHREHVRGVHGERAGGSPRARRDRRARFAGVASRVAERARRSRARRPSRGRSDRRHLRDGAGLRSGRSGPATRSTWPTVRRR